LIELLVVIASSPFGGTATAGVEQGETQAMSANCLSNQKQLALVG